MVSSYEHTAGVDNSLEALTGRLKVLQQPLGDLMGKACLLFDDLFPQAPHARDRAEEYPVYRTSSANFCPVEGIPMARELTVILDGGRWLRVFRNSVGSPNAFPRKRLWVNKPEGQNTRRTNVLFTHKPARADMPYDIEVVDYTPRGICAGFVGEPYHKTEPYIAEAEISLDEAKDVATRLGMTTT